MAKRLVFTGKQAVAAETFETGEPDAGKVRVRTLKSLISIGTETIVYSRLFDEGTHYDAWVQYPFYPGYACIGEVEAVGASVEGLSVGDRVACRAGHASHHVIPAGQAYPVPADLDAGEAAWFALAKIAFMGAKAVRYSLGERVLVLGAGPVGQMTVRWANAGGAERVIVVDPVEPRLAMAADGGAAVTIAQGADECEQAVRDANAGELPDVVVDTTGNPVVFAAALGLARRFGRVLLLGDTGRPAGQHLTPDVVLEGLTIVGAHDPHVTDEWTERRIVGLFFRLVETGRFRVAGLNTHEFSPGACKEAYELVSQKRGETMGVVFDWT